MRACFVYCDRCDSRARADCRTENLPDGWSREGGQDLCPICTGVLAGTIADFWDSHGPHYRAELEVGDE